MGLTPIVMKSEFVGSQSHVTQSYNTPEISSTGASSDSFGTQVSAFSDLVDYNNDNNPNPLDYYQPLDSITDFQHVEPNTQWMQTGDSSDIFWNDENMLFLQQQLMNDDVL